MSGFAKGGESPFPIGFHPPVADTTVSGAKEAEDFGSRKEPEVSLKRDAKGREIIPHNPRGRFDVV